jgi:putative copper resistance protein D
MAAISRSIPFVLNADWAIFTVLVGSLYAVGLTAMRRKGSAHPPRRIFAFYGGMLGVLAAFVSPLDNYDVVSLFAHTAQHLILMFMVAPLVALGAPITVLMAAAPRSIRRRVLTLLNSGAMCLLTQPMVAMAIFVAVQAITLTSAFFNAAVEGDALHLLEHALFLGAGFLFWWPILAVDPTPRKTPLKTRYVALVLAMPLEVLFAMAILWAGRPLYPHYASLPGPWGGHSALLSQRKAGALLLLVPTLALGIPSLLFASALKAKRYGR